MPQRCYDNASGASNARIAPQGSPRPWQFMFLSSALLCSMAEDVTHRNERKQKSAVALPVTFLAFNTTQRLITVSTKAYRLTPHLAARQSSSVHTLISNFCTAQFKIAWSPGFNFSVHRDVFLGLVIPFIARRSVCVCCACARAYVCVPCVFSGLTAVLLVLLNRWVSRPLDDVRPSMSYSVNVCRRADRPNCVT